MNTNIILKFCCLINNIFFNISFLFYYLKKYNETHENSMESHLIIFK